MRTYQNPVYGHSCPDPFVLKHCGRYFCYCTGFARDGRCFGVLHSTDLVLWTELPGAMEPLPENHTEYWAPEVTCWNGRFYMYYSCGDGVRMQIRVAVGGDPAGPFADSGRRLTPQEFAIDAHVFEDDDGGRYLFYATDFLEHSRIGTGTVVDRMLDPFTLAGNPQPVSRARYDWQIFDPKRAEKGGVCWHTVEGPFVLKHKGRYYQMFSGGNWKDATYGVSYAAAASITGPDEWTQLEHDDRNPLVLRTLPGVVTGPGHNSVVRGPDNLQLFCVYHRWSADAASRLLSIDRLEIVGSRISVLGPSTGSQPAPLLPAFAGFEVRAASRAGTESGWFAGPGDWIFDADTAHQQAERGRGRALFRAPFDAFVMEICLRAAPSTDGRAGALGAGLYAASGCVLSVLFETSDRSGRVSWTGAPGLQECALSLPAGYDPFACHLLRLEVDGNLVRLCLDGQPRWRGLLAARPAGVQLDTRDQPSSFSGFSLTPGWQDLFTAGDLALQDLGWRALVGQWEVRDGELRSVSRGNGALAVKERVFGSYEVVVNARPLDGGAPGCLGFAPVLDSSGSGPLFTLELEGAPRLCLRRLPAAATRSGLFGLPPEHSFDLPSGRDWHDVQQFRFWKQQQSLLLQVGSQTLGEVVVAQGPARVGLFACRGGAAFEAVRLSALAAPGSEGGGVRG